MNKKILAFFVFFFSSKILATVEIPLTYSLPLKKVNFSQIISSEIIVESGVNSLSQVLAQNSQIQLLDVYGDGSRTAINMRGFGDNAAVNSLVLVDGQPWMNPDTSGINLNSLPLDSIQQIEIIPGSSSVLYGDQAVGGVIKITTKNPQTNERKVSGALGSFATKNAAIIIGDNFINNFSYRVTASHLFSNNYREHNQNQVNNATALINYTSELSQIRLNYNKYNQHLQLPCALTPEQAQENPRQAVGNLAYDNEDTDYFSLIFKRYFANWLLEINGDSRLMQGVGAYSSSGLFSEERKMEAVNAKLSGMLEVAHYKIFPIVGAEFLHGSYGFDAKKSREQEIANYAQLEFPILTRFKLIIGGRAANAFYNLDESGIEQTPKNKAFANDVELLWEALNNFRFYIKRECGFRFPKVDEETWTVNNQPLKTQLGTTYEFGTVATFSKSTLQATVFRMNIQNEIISIPDPVSNFFTYNENLAATTRNGVSTNLSFIPFANTTVLAGYNYVDAKLAAGIYSGNAMPFVAKNSVSLSVNYRFQNSLNLNLGSLYTGSRYPLNDVANRVQPFGGFTVYNFCVSFQKPYYDLSLKINNFTNKLFYGYIVAAYQGDNTKLALYPSSGINALLTLSVKI